VRSFGEAYCGQLAGGINQERQSRNRGLRKYQRDLLRNSRLLSYIEVVAVSDIDEQRAKARADEYQIPRALTVPELLAETGIDIVINLTIPSAHAQAGLAALEAARAPTVRNRSPFKERRRAKCWNWHATGD
jgi:predicted dehydrogenase